MKVSPLSHYFSIRGQSEVIPSFKKAISHINSQQTSHFLSGQFLQDLMITYTEGVANAITHAHEIKKQGKIDCQLKISQSHVQLNIFDHGSGFHLNKIPLPQFRGYAEKGRGIFMMRQLMDSVSYQRHSRVNTLILKRQIIGTDQNSRDLDLLYEISHTMVQAIDNQWLEPLASKASERGRLHPALPVEGATLAPKIDSIYQIILEKAVEIFGVEKASILIFDPQIKKLKVVASQGLKQKIEEEVEVKAGEGISGFVFQHAKPCLIEDIDKNQSGWKKKKKYKSRSFISAPMICSPLRLGQKSVGVINMTDRLDGKSFDKKDLRLLTTIANQAAAYLHICRLLSEAKETEFLKRELQITRHIQQSYLPETPPLVKGIKLSGWCEMAQSVGGDYYDFILPDKENLFVVIADVSGHHMAAAMTMANFRSQLKAFLLREKRPGTILSLLNKSLYGDLTKNGQFISMILIRFDLKNKKIEIANAGHPPPLVKKNNQVKPLFSYQNSNLILGVFQREIYLTRSCPFDSGSFLFLYTDGAIECMNSDKKRLGLGGLVDILKEGGILKIDQMMLKVKKELKQFIGDHPLQDDISMVGIQLL